MTDDRHYISQTDIEGGTHLDCSACPWSVTIPLPCEFPPLLAALNSHPGEAFLGNPADQVPIR